MACPVCGNASACLHERARTAILIDPEFSDDTEQQFSRSLDEQSAGERPRAERLLEHSASLAVAANGGPQPQIAADDEEYWRQEVASRVQQHRARRRGRVDPNATMQLDFAGDDVYAVPETLPLPVRIAPPLEESTKSIKERVMAMVMASAAYRQAAREPEVQGLAELRRARIQESESLEVETPSAIDSESSSPLNLQVPKFAEPETAEAEPVVYMPGDDDPRPDTYKVIQFPRQALTGERGAQYQALASPDDLELAEPVLDTPRILDAPEPEAVQLDMLQSFADIRLEAEQRHEIDDLPPASPAPLNIRVFAGMVDVLMLIAGGIVFAATVLVLSSALPPARLLLPAMAATMSLLWLLYQYVFLVYSSGTPGMRMAALELHTFHGEPVTVALRRNRAFASLLSACSLGLGYFWAYVDEDTLCWHDRITRTCLQEGERHEDR
jgi:uncharacterized RDD family membrane protein YckC